MHSQIRRIVSVVLLVALGFFSITLAAQKTVHVKGYVKKDGTVVKPYDRRAPGTATPGASTPSTAAASAEATDQRGSEPEDQTVYVTKTGAKYHRAGCQYLARSSIPMKLKDAAARYSPCSVCRPPSLKKR